MVFTYYSAGCGSLVGSVSAWYADGGEFDPHILSWNLVMKKLLRHSLPFADSRRAVNSFEVGVWVGEWGGVQVTSYKYQYKV